MIKLKLKFKDANEVLIYSDFKIKFFKNNLPVGYNLNKTRISEILFHTKKGSMVSQLSNTIDLTKALLIFY